VDIWSSVNNYGHSKGVIYMQLDSGVPYLYGVNLNPAVSIHILCLAVSSCILAVSRCISE